MIRIDTRVLALTLLVATITGCTNKSSAPQLPEPITGPVLLRVQAQGVQIYVWKLDAAGKGVWAFKAPEATFAGSGVTGKHYAGPTWEAADGSKVIAKKIDETPSPDPASIPWLTLQATKHEGDGVMSKVTLIRRIDTRGGKAPASPAAAAGEETRVSYTATYVFYGPGATTQPAR